MMRSVNPEARSKLCCRHGRWPVLGVGVVVSLLLFCNGSWGDTLRLEGGSSITGTILLRRADSVVVDLGFAVIDVPSRAIVSIEKGREAKQDAGEMEEGDGIYFVEPDRQELTVRENVPRCGEAVVEVRTEIGLGSGFVVDPAGYVITNDHVVAGMEKLTVTVFKERGEGLDRQSFHSVKVVAVNPSWDLALLRIESKEKLNLAAVPLGNSGQLRRGQPVFSIGSPMGLSRSVSEGIVSRVPVALSGQLLIQTTAKISPGNSGGPLFNLRGEVVGVTSLKVVAAGAEGLGFAIPSEVLKLFLRNRAAFAIDPDSPETGYRYNEPPAETGMKEKS